MESKPVRTGDGRDADGDGAPEAAATSAIPTIKYQASIYSGPDKTVPTEFASAVLSLETTLGLPVWLLVQSYHSHERGVPIHLDADVVELFVSNLTELPKGRLALLIDSPGGDAKSAYGLATLLRKRCDGFTAVIPRTAKSAATLLALGASELILGEIAELGPLDVQVFDEDRDEIGSALNEFQALERLNAFALEALDRTMMLMIDKTGKRVDRLIPMICEFVSGMTRPLFEKIDVVHYTQTARDLKIGEDYAVRLLSGKYGTDAAATIARALVANYSDHDFLIDRKEAADIGLEPATVKPELEDILYRLRSSIDGMTLIGRLKETTASET